jgi:hypothetical protein
MEEKYTPKDKQRVLEAEADGTIPNAARTLVTVIMGYDLGTKSVDSENIASGSKKSYSPKPHYLASKGD